MPTALELYYNKSKNTDEAKEQAVKEFLGDDIIKKKSPGMFVKLLDLLDRPGNAVRALLVGKMGGLKGLIPFAKTIEDLTGLDVALNKEDLVRGSEVIEKWFGLKGKKGKFDPTDVLGFLVEVVADPLWLLWGPGLTKLGKATQLARGLAGQVKIGTAEMSTIKAAIKAAKAGKELPPGFSKELKKAFNLIYEGGHKPKGLLNAKSWAEQTASGERALLQFGFPGYRTTAIKGKSVWEGAEKISTKVKAGKIGELFLAPAKRVSVKNQEFNDIVTHLSRDLPKKEQEQWLRKLVSLSEKAKLKGVKSEDITDLLEAAYAGPGLKRAIESVRVGRLKKAGKLISEKKHAIGKLRPKKRAAQLKLKKAQELKVRPAPPLLGVPGKVTKKPAPKPKVDVPPVTPTKVITPREAPFPTAGRQAEGTRFLVQASKQTQRIAQRYENRIAGLQTKINVLKEVGTPKANKEIRRLVKVIDRVERKAVRDEIKGANRLALKQYTAQAAVDTAKMKGRVNVAKNELGRIQKELTKLHKQIAKKRVAPTISASVQRAEVKSLTADLNDLVLRNAPAEEIASVKSRIARVTQKTQVAPVRKLIQRQYDLANRADEILNSVPKEARGDLMELARELYKANEQILKFENIHGIPTRGLQAALGYSHRIPTKEFRKFLAENPGKVIRDRVGRDFTARHGARLERSSFIAGKTRGEINELFKANGFKGDNVFEPNIARATFERAKKATKAVGVSRTMEDTIQRFGRSSVPPGELWTEADKIVGKMGLKLPLTGKYIPTEIANALDEVHRISTNKEIQRGLVGFNKFFKGAFTVYWPAYHGRNAMSNVYLNFIGGVKNPQRYLEATQLQKSARKTYKIMEKTGDEWTEAAAKVDWPTVTLGTGVKMPGGEFYDMANRYGILGQSLGEIGVEETGDILNKLNQAKNLAGRIGTHQNPAGRFGMAAGMTIENNARLAHFLDKTGKGLDPAQAARSVKRVLFDYNDLSQFEKEYLRDQVFLFYTFARKNIALQSQTLIQQPAKQAIFSHLAGGSPQMQLEAPYYKDYEQERLMIPTPFRNKEGQKWYLRGTGAPIEEAFGPFAGPGVGLAERSSRVLSRTLSRITPVPKGIIEAATKTNLYFDRPITDWTEWTMNQLPIARVASTVQSLRSPYEPVPSKVSGLATGLRFRPYDADLQKGRAVRDVAKRELARKGVYKYAKIKDAKDAETKALLKASRKK